MSDPRLRVLITDNLSSAGLMILEQSPELEVVKGSPENVREQLKDVDGIVIRSGTKLTADVLEGQSRLKVVVRAGVGVDNVDLEAATREGIIVMNTPTGNTTSTAEHAFALMLSLSRNIPQAVAKMREGGWDRKKYTGSQLAGKTLAVVGLGRIGLTLARRALAFEMKVIGYDPFLSEERARELGIELHRDVDELIDQCDYLSVHTPLTDETRDLINADRLKNMRSGARVINCARGGIVNEADLIEAVKAGTIAGAALDVYPQEPPPEDDPIRDVENIITTPHLGASTAEAQESVAIEAAEIMRAFLIDNEVRHAINMAPISGTELKETRAYLDLGYRLGLLQTQLLRQRFKSAGIQTAKITYQGEVCEKKTKLITSSFVAGLMTSGSDEPANIINAESIARDRGIHIEESSVRDAGDFASVVHAAVVTDNGEFSVSGTIFGDRFLRLVRLGGFHLEAFLDGQLLIFRHQDKPGLIGFIGSVCGNHGVNISHMTLGREEKGRGGGSGGQAVAVLNLDAAPTPGVAKEILSNPDVTGVDLVDLPPAGATLPWLDSAK